MSEDTPAAAAAAHLVVRWQTADKVTALDGKVGEPGRRLFVVVDATRLGPEALRDLALQLVAFEDADGRSAEVSVIAPREVAGAVGFHSFDGPAVDDWIQTSVYGHLVWLHPFPQINDDRPNPPIAVHFSDSGEGDAMRRACFPFQPEWTGVRHNVFGLRPGAGALDLAAAMESAADADWGIFEPKRPVRTRLLGDWIAVEPLDQGEGDVLDEFSGLYLPATRKARADAVRGRVLLCGPRVTPEIQPGMVVVFQRFSGHPGQTDPIPAETFGGTPGRWAALVRLVEGPIVEHLEERRAEFQKHLRNLEKLEGVVDKASKPRLRLLYDHYRFELRRVNEQLYRVPGLRTRRAHPIEMPWSVGRGVEAIVEDPR